jgi:GAF domain-containing protein
MTDEPGRRRAATGGTRDLQLTEVFVALADTLVDDYDVADFMHLLVTRSVALLSVDAAGLLLSDQRGQLQVVASSSHQARLLDMLEIQHHQGPCWDCFLSGHPVTHVDTHPDGASGGPIRDEPWPMFTTRRRNLGFRSVYAVPLRLRAQVIGALNLFRSDPGAVPETDLRLAQGLADVATIGLLQERALREQQLLAVQLQTALTTRIAIEQAKGVLAERSGLEMNDAFEAIRAYARSQNQHLTAVAKDIIENKVPLGVILPGRA